ncbi:MAG: hypothetical protein NDI66_01550 [Pseudomonas sp.]|nr:hypothetical protein [Pseudomonas sp.]
MSSRNHRTTLSLATLATFVVFGLGMASAHAGDAGSVTVTRDYVFRGISQTNQEPALQADVESATGAGFCVAAPYRGSPGDYPTGFNRAASAELHVGRTDADVPAGIVSAKYSYALTDLFGYADTYGSGCLDVPANWESVPGWTLHVHGDKQWIENNAALECADCKPGVTKAFDGGFSVAVAVTATGTDADESPCTNPQGNVLGDAACVSTLGRSS